MNQCLECGCFIPDGEEFCCGMHENLFLGDMHMTPGYTLLDFEPGGNVNGKTRTHRKKYDDPLPPSVEIPEKDFGELPF